MVAKSNKGVTKKPNKTVKKAVKIKKITNKPMNKLKKAVVSVKAKSKHKAVTSTPKVRLKTKPKLKAMRTITPKKKIDKIAKKSLLKKIKQTPKPKLKTKLLSKSIEALPKSVVNTAPVVFKVSESGDASMVLSGPTNKFEPYNMHVVEEYMNDQQLKHFTNILESWKQELMLEVDHTITEMKEADILSDLNDRATQEETFNLELKARDRERRLIKKIEVALQKIKNKEYGYCESCGVEIGVRRLEARPTATLCIECKTLAEIREKRV